MESEILWPDLKKYLTSSKDCHFLPNECYIDPLSGELEFDFSSLSESGNSELIFKKISGNGEFLFQAEDSSLICKVTSRKKQMIPVDLFFDQRFKIKRTPNSNGKIAFLGIRISDMISESGLTWKKILQQTGKHSKLFLKEERLFAKEKGFLDTTNILNLETNPPNAFRISEEKFVFLTGCEIIKIEIGQKNQKVNNNYFPHIETVNSSQEKEKLSIVSQTTLAQTSPPRNPESRIFFNSQNFSFLRGVLNQKSGGKIISSSGLTYLNIQSGGKITFSIPELSNENYILTLSLKKLSGNGKVEIEIWDEEKLLSTDFLVADAIFREKNIFLKGQKIKGGKKISLRMNAGATGEILISKILILHDFIPVSQNFQPKKQIFPNLIDAEIRKRTQNFSVYDYSFNSFSNIKFDFSQTWMVCGWRAKQFVHKLLPSLPQIKIYDDNLSINAKLSNQNPDLIWGEIDFFVPGEKIYLFSWPGNYFPTEKQKEKLSACSIILTSSINNYFWLKNNISAKIILTSLTWPQLETIKRKEKQYYFAIFKNKIAEQNFYSSWPSNAPAVYVLGGTTNHSTQFLNLSECEPYSEIFSYLSSAQGIIYFGDETSDSKFLSLAFDLGLPLLTNHKSILNQKDLSSVLFSKNGIIDSDQIIQFLNLTTKEKRNENWKNNFLEFMSKND